MDPYVGEIRLFAGKFAPRGWAICDGTLLSVQGNTVLFSIIGTQFGGDGKTNFALPDMRNRVPMHQGQGTGLTLRKMASNGGENAITLTMNNIPTHSHSPNCSGSGATTKDPTLAIWAYSGDRGGAPVYTSTTPVEMNPLAIGVSGGSQPHNNVQPYLALNFIIALEGIFPPKSS